MTRPRRLGALCTCLFILPLIGCKQDAPVTLHPDEIRLGGAVAAFYASPQDIDMTESSKGYVVLVDADGSTRAIETAGMDSAELVWDEEGIYFTDRGHDYRVGDAITAVSNQQESAIQHGMHRIGGRMLVSVYNFGFTGGGGYSNEVVVTDLAAGTSSVTEVEGDYNVTARCGGRVIGVANDPGKLDHSPGTDAAARRPRLVQLYPAPAGSPVLGTAEREWPLVAGSGMAPCHRGQVVLLIENSPEVAADESAQVNQVTIGTWNTRTGRLREVPLVSPDGSHLPSSQLHTKESADLGAVWPLYDAGSIQADGRLLWYAPTGDLLETNPKTGMTELLVRTGVPSGDNTVVTFTEDSVVIADVDDDGDMQLHTFDRSTGERLGRVHVEDSDDYVGGANILRGLAARP